MIFQDPQLGDTGYGHTVVVFDKVASIVRKVPIAKTGLRNSVLNRLVSEGRG